eukprot:TRINITY_DN14005_c0_g1_i1.p1 TRINITY_DN14005_c0_g1~~TRINITY_DN14005_c0_g1_i1.p1  ORF type:complete len:853 (+),score=199.38 TRINITY_DN14005_c0_g1_i1:110-2668(+)
MTVNCPSPPPSLATRTSSLYQSSDDREIKMWLSSRSKMNRSTDVDEMDADLAGGGYMPVIHDKDYGEEEEEEHEEPEPAPRPVLRFPAKKKPAPEPAEQQPKPAEEVTTTKTEITVPSTEKRTPATRRKAPVHFSNRIHKKETNASSPTPQTRSPNPSSTIPPSSVRALRASQQAGPENGVREGTSTSYISSPHQMQQADDFDKERERARYDREKEKGSSPNVKSPSKEPAAILQSIDLHRYRAAKRKTRRVKERVKVYVNLSSAKPAVLSAANTLKLEFAPLRDAANLLWTDRSLSVEAAKSLIDEKQRVNRFPGMRDLCNKVLFTQHLNRMQALFPDDFAFYPTTYCLPGDEDELSAVAPERKGRRKIDPKKSTWIVKPSKGRQGAGIFLTQDLSELLGERRNPEVQWVVQKYIDRPLLIDGLKFDLRLYVLVLCVDPLKIYLFDEGLARFATTPYKPLDSHSIHNAYMHLTNYSLNKESENFVPSQGTEPEQEDGASKRTLKSVRAWLESQGHDSKAVWEKVNKLVVNCMLALQPSIQLNLEAIQKPGDDNYKCFQILGFDVMFDEDLKPWLLEVNASPSVSADSPIDLAVKIPLITTSIKLGTFGLVSRQKPSHRKVFEESHSGQYTQVYPSKDPQVYEHLVLFNKELRDCFDKACGLKKGEMSATRFCKFFRECGVIRSFKQLGQDKKTQSILRVDETVERPTSSYATNKAFDLRRKLLDRKDDQSAKEAPDGEYALPVGFEPKYGLRNFNFEIPPHLVDKIRTLTQPELELLFLKKSKMREGQTGLSFFEFINIVVELATHAYGAKDFDHYSFLGKLRLFIPKRLPASTPGQAATKSTPARDPSKP